MVYSGEAYNFRNCAASLASAGHRFATPATPRWCCAATCSGARRSSTAQRHVRLRHLGPARAQALMIRDRMGIKPLLLLPDARRRAVRLGAQGDPGQPARQAGSSTSTGLRELIAFGQDARSTLSARACARCEPGTIVTRRPRAASASAPTGGWSRSCTPTTCDTTVAHVRELLDDIVRRQLVADVPQCVLLSGGLDSSAITALAARAAERTEPVRTFAVDFVGQARHFKPDEMRADHGHARTCTTWPSTSAPTTPTSSSTTTSWPTWTCAAR